MSVLSAAILLILIMNPLGNLTVFLSTLKPVDPHRHTQIIIRETLFAYALLVVFMFFGQLFLQSVQISEQALGVSGGIIMFIIAIRMIFPEEKSNKEQPVREPFIVPLATPMMAGPGALTTVLLLSTQQPERKFTWLMAITIASITVGTVVFSGRYLRKYLGERGLIALERLSGMMLTAIAVQMFLSGVNAYFKLH